MVVGVISTTIIIVAVIMPIISVYEPQSELSESQWYYDDYKILNEVDSVSGSLELILVGDVEYVHAKDVGNGVINYQNGTTENIIVEKAQLDLIYMYGQSNAAYRNAVPSEADPIPRLGTAYYYGLEDRSGPTAAENNTGMDLSECDFWTMLDENGESRIGDKAPSFSAEYTKITGHKIYWVCGAVGNKGISQFQPPNAFMWTYGKSVLENAVELVDTDKFNLEVTYYLWIQGEANATSPIDQYKSLFLNMHNAMINGDMGYKFKGCFISIVRDQNGENSAIAQRELCKEYSTIHLGADIAKTFTVQNGLMGSDDLHYSQAGNNLIGETMGTNVGDYVRGPTNDLSNQFYYDLFSLIPLFCIIGLIVYICISVGISDSGRIKFEN